MVEMPAKVFQKIDRKNYSYMKKKAMYLAYLANKINNDLVETKTYFGTSFNPVLKLIPSRKISKRFTVYVHLSLENTAFELNIFSPGRNNVQPKWFFKSNVDIPG